MLHTQMMPPQPNSGGVSSNSSTGSGSNNVNNKTTNLYRLAMSSTSNNPASIHAASGIGAAGSSAVTNFSMTSEDFPALPGAPPSGNSNHLSGLLDTSSLVHPTQQQQQHRLEGIIHNNNNNTSSSSTNHTNHNHNSNNSSSTSSVGLTLASSSQSRASSANSTTNNNNNTHQLGSFADMDINNNNNNISSTTTSLGNQPGGLGGLLGGQLTASQLQQQQQPPPPLQPQPQPPSTRTNNSVVVVPPQPSSIAGSALSGDFGLLGLLGVIRMSDADRNALALGSDLTALGLNLNSSDQLYSTFASPWSESPTTREPHYQLPMCYYMQPPALKTGHLSKFAQETLFYIFYALPKDVLQAYAAQELYSREWKYHVDLKLWFKMAGPTETQSPNNGGGGAPQYIYFDINSWERRLFTGSIQTIIGGLLAEEEVRVQFPNS